MAVLSSVIKKAWHGSSSLNVFCANVEQRSMIEEQMHARGFDILFPVRPMLASKARTLFRLAQSLPAGLLKHDEEAMVEYLLENPPLDEHVDAQCAGSFKLMADLNFE